MVGQRWGYKDGLTWCEELIFLEEREIVSRVGCSPSHVDGARLPLEVHMHGLGKARLVGVHLIPAGEEQDGVITI